MAGIEALVADITTLSIDAIVNPSNPALAPGGGLDGAIRRAAGPRINEATAALGGCPVGDARVTPGFDLPAWYVIHTVGPVWRGGQSGEPALLAAAYTACLARAVEVEASGIAIPAISTGIYGYPAEAATAIAVATVAAQRPSGLRVVFCCFDAAMLAIYRRCMAAAGVPTPDPANTGAGAKD